MKTGLWGHALLLAGKMDARTHASVMTRFANSLDMNDPLQTLYQLMSDRQPAAVTVGIIECDCDFLYVRWSKKIYLTLIIIPTCYQ